MPKSNGLCPLQVGITGHNSPGVTFRQLQEGFLKPCQQARRGVNFLFQVHFDIKGYLVVPAPGSMKLTTHIPDTFCEQFFDIHMDILCPYIKLDPAVFYICKNRRQSGDNGISLCRRNNPLSAKHPGMGNTAPDILPV